MSWSNFTIFKLAVDFSCSLQVTGKNTNFLHRKFFGKLRRHPPTRIHVLVWVIKFYESCCRAVVIEWSEMHKRISAFNTLCGPPLLLILAYTFVAVSGTLSLSRQTNYGTFIWRMTEFLFVFMYCLFIIFLVIMATIVRKNLDALRNSVICQLLQKTMSEDSVNIRWKLGLEIFSDYKLFEFSVMSLFPLDLNLVSYLTASIITYTILFLQLQSSTSIWSFFK